MKKIALFQIIVIISLQVSFAQNTKVGILFDQFASVRWKIDEAALIEEFTKLDIETIVMVAHSDFELQMEQGQKLIDENVSAIVIISVDGTKQHTFFSKAKDQGILLVAYDRPIFDKKLDLYISYDNFLIGKTQAQHLLDHVDQGDIIMINGPVSDVNAIKFREGQLEVLKPHIESGRINIVHDIILDSWNETTALLSMYSHELNFTNIKGLLFALDSFVGAALEYSDNDEKFKGIYMTGQDPSPKVIDRLKNGTQNMSVLKPIQPLAQKTAELTLSKIRKENHPDIVNIKFDGKNNVDGYLFDPVVLTKENVIDYQDLLYK